MILFSHRGKRGSVVRSLRARRSSKSGVGWSVVCLGVVLCFSCSQSYAWDALAGGDHLGADWTLSGATNIAGVHYNIGTFTVNNGVTATVADYTGANYGSLVVTASVINVEGTINADDAGALGGVADGGDGGDGGTDGGGDGSTGSAGGGGSYGAVGGVGDFGTDDTPAGSTYGTSSGTDIAMGSGGGGGQDSGAGGDGGGMIKLISTGAFTNTGTITANGQTGPTVTVDRDDCGGGGSGGGIYLSGTYIVISGTVSVNGGAGGSEDGVSNDHGEGGGGGGGGRIKIFYATLDTTGSTITQTGGAAGSGTDGIGAAGSAGTYYTEYVPIPTAPTMTNYFPLLITETSASVRGEITSTGAAPTKAWAYWGLDDGMDTNANWAATNDFGFVVEQDLSNSATLLAGGTYYYRLYATNSAGEGWGEPSMVFTTLQAGVSIAANSIVEGNLDPTNLVFTVTLSATSAVNVVCYWVTSNGTATVADNDYVTNSGTLTINAGLTNGTITVVVKGDIIDTDTEYFTVTITNLTDGTNVSANLVATGTITDDDYVPPASSSTSGDIAIYRDTGADALTNGAILLHPWDTTVRADTDTYNLTSNTNIQCAAGHHLVIYSCRFDDPVEDVAYRSEINTHLILNDSELAIGRSQGFIRRDGGDFEMVTAGGGIIEVASDDDSLVLKSQRTDTYDDSMQREPDGSSIQLLKLDDTWDYLRLESSSDKGGLAEDTEILVDYDVTNELDTGSFAHDANTPSNIILKTAGHYLVMANTKLKHPGSNTRTIIKQIFTLNSNEVDGSATTVYVRGNANSDNCNTGSVSSAMILETSSANEVLSVRCLNVEGATLTMHGGHSAVTIAKVPDDGEYIWMRDDDGEDFNPSVLAAIGWDVTNELDSAAFTHSAATPSRVGVNVDDDYLFLCELYDNNDADARGKYYQQWRTNGTGILKYGTTARYMRDDTGADEVGNWSGAIVGLSSGEYVEVVCSALATANGETADTNLLQGVRLSSWFPNATPVVLADSYSNLTETNAWLIGNLTSTGGAPATVFCYWGTEDRTNDWVNWDYTNIFAAPRVTGLHTTDTSVAEALTGGTTYYFRYAATNTLGEDYGEALSFITPETPVITNTGVSNLISSAQLTGDMTAGGWADVYIYWGTSDGMDTNANWGSTNVLTSQGEGAFIYTPTNLTPGATYYYRCWASNSVDTAWASPSIQFTTPLVPADYFVAIPADGGSDANDGLTWATAFATVSNALNVSKANGGASTIFVAAGTYTLADPAHSYGMNNSASNSQLYGGFQTNDTYADRDWTNNVTELDGEETVNNIIRKEDAGHFVVDGFHIANGDNSDVGDADGAAFYYTDGTFELRNCTLTNNTAEDFGGAVYLANTSATNIITNCVFIGNSTTGNDGGALMLNGGGVELWDCTFAENDAGNFNGGAVYINAAGSSLKLWGCTFTSNSAYHGGAVLDNSVDGLSTVVDCTFEGNQAENGYGGAIYLVDTTGDIAFTNCVFDNNSCDLIADGGRDGGAIYALNGGVMVLANCLFTNNLASPLPWDGTDDDDGGAIYLGGEADGFSITAWDTDFINNRAPQHGGAIFINSRVVTNFFTNCVFRGNGSAGGDGDATAGAIYAQENGNIFRNCEFTDNSSAYSYGAVYIQIGWTDNAYPAEFYDCTFTNNVAALHMGGAIYLAGGGVGRYFTDIVISNCVFDSNKSLDDGGCVWADNSLTMSVLDSDFINNVSTNQEGGALLIDDVSAVTIRNCLFAKNQANLNNDGAGGGAIHFRGPLTSLVENCTFYTNFCGDTDANEGGGAIQMQQGTLNLTNCIFEGNISDCSGGVNGGDDIHIDLLDYLNIGYCNVDTNSVWVQTPANVNWGTGFINEDARFVDVDNDDYHLKSTGGHYNPTGFVADAESSKCIDAGGPGYDYDNEEEDNGDQINLGRYGNTVEASKKAAITGPTVTLNGGADNVISNGATLNAEMTAGGQATNYIFYGTNDMGETTVGWDVTCNFGLLSESTFSTNLTGLTQGQLYYYRAYTTNSAGFDWTEPVQFTPGVAFVDTNMTAGLNTGEAWTNAYTTLSNALANANTGLWIWVAKGTHYPGDVAAHTFTLGSRSIYGGFTNGMEAASERDAVANVTILSGVMSGANSVHILTKGDASLSVVDGFTISDSEAMGASYGGGLLVTNGPVSVNDCIFENNTAEYGGAVSVGITVGAEAASFSNCVFRGNSTVDNNGGAFYAWAGASAILLTDCTFDSNTAGGGDSGGGGAILTEGGTSLTIDNCLFTNNQCITTDKDYGGAICMNNDSDGGRIVAWDSEFLDNHASGGGGAIYANGYDGSGITHLFTNCVFRENTSHYAVNADADGGAVNIIRAGAKFYQCEFTDQKSRANGGAVQVILTAGAGADNAPVEFYNCNFTNNAANQGGVVFFDTAEASGAYIDSQIFENCRFDGNQATNGHGGAIYFDGGDSLTLANCLFTNNTAITTAEDCGGALFGNGQADGAYIVAWDTDFFNNSAQRDGGAIRIDSYAVTNFFTNCLFRSNTGVIDAAADGGAIYATRCGNIFRQCEFTDNSTYDDGGAVRINAVSETANHPAWFYDCTFINNLANTKRGGAIYADSGTTANEIFESIIISNCTFNGNHSLLAGGAVYADGSMELMVLDTDFISNVSTNQEGGGLFVGDVRSTVRNSLFAKNQANLNNGGAGGGAIHFLGPLTSLVENCTFYTNYCGDTEEGGGAIQLQAGLLNLTNCIFAGNKSLCAPTSHDIHVDADAIDKMNIGYCNMDTNNVWEETAGSVTWGTWLVNLDPRFVDVDNNDYHLKSTGGHYNPTGWVTDAVSSKCIDRGGPGYSYTNETADNGDRINLGRYGNTAEASRKPSPTAPTVVNHAATNITMNSADMVGEVTSTGAVPTEAWIYWGNNDGMDTNDNWDATNDFGFVAEQDLSNSATALLASETYYYRLYAANSAGTNWAEPSMVFTTLQAGVSIADNSVLEGDSGTVDLEFTVTLSATSSVDVVCEWIASNRTATVADNDYDATNATLTISAGSITGLITVVVNGDEVDAVNETFTVTITSLTGGTNIDLVATGTITDDDYVAVDEVVIDDSVWNAANASGNPRTVFISDQVGYVFYVDSDERGAYQITTNGGLTWNGTVQLGTDIADQNNSAVIVWYDQWTPGNTGTKIHTIFFGQSAEILQYNYIDTVDNSTTSWVTINDFTGEWIVNTDTEPSVIRATDGALVSYAAADGNRVFRNADGTGVGTWTNTSMPAVDDTDYAQLMPLANGDVMVIVHDDAGTLDAYIWTNATATWSARTEIDGDWGNTDDEMSFSATLYADSSDTNIYVVGHAGPNGDFDIRAYHFTESDRTWTKLPDVVEDSSQYSFDACAFVDANNGDLYAVYNRGSADVGVDKTTLDIYYKKYNGAIWAAAEGEGPFNITLTNDYRHVGCNFASDDRMYAVWYDAVNDYLIGATMIDIVAGLPDINNAAGASGITDTNALLVGNLTHKGTTATTVYCYWGTVDRTNDWDNWQYTTNFAAPRPTGLHTADTADVEALTADTTYYYRYAASNSFGLVYTDAESFTTLVLAVDNYWGATNISTTEAWLNGHMISDGIAADVWIFWGDEDGFAVHGGWDYSTNLGEFSTAQMITTNVPIGNNVTNYYRFMASNSLYTIWAPTSMPYASGNWSEPFFEGFEDRYEGNMQGQGGWIVDPASINGVLCQTTNVQIAGSKAGRIAGGGSEVSFKHEFQDATLTNMVSVSVMSKPVFGLCEGAIDADSTVIFYVDPVGDVVGYDGTSPTTASVGQVTMDTWTRFVWVSDYQTRTWVLAVDGVEVFSGLDFYNTNNAVFAEFEIIDSAADSDGLYDDITIEAGNMLSVQGGILFEIW